MFAPNRLMTRKEQFLLTGFVVAIIVGCITVLLHDKIVPDTADTGNAVVIPAKAPNPVPATTQSKKDVSVSPPASQKQEVPVVAATANETTQPSEVIGVAVMGAVRKPGLYFMDDDARVADLIAKAGGAAENADLSDILLTAPLVDETTLTVPELPVVTVNESHVGVKRRGTTSGANPPWYRRSVASYLPQSPAPQPQLPQTMPSGVSEQPAAATGLLNVNQATSEQLQQLPGIGPVFAERIIEERTKQPFMTVDELKRVSGIGDKRLEAIRSFITAP